MRLLVVAVLLGALGCRERPKAQAVEAPVDARASRSVEGAADAVVDTELPDTLASAVAELEDARSDAAPLPFEVKIVSVKVTPKNALLDPETRLAAQRWRFLACGRLLPEAGASTLVLKVGEGGEPVSATSSKDPFGECLVKAGRAIAFDEPDSGLATVELALTFAPR